MSETQRKIIYTKREKGRSHARFFRRKIHMIRVSHRIRTKTIRFQAKTLLGKNASRDFSKKDGT